MTYTDFEEIERIHSQWSMLDKISKMAYLRNEYQRLDSIAYQFGFYLKSKGGYITDEERKLLQYLVEMMDSIKSEEERSKRSSTMSGGMNGGKRSQKSYLEQHS